jgi:hypothetical protein
MCALKDPLCVLGRVSSSKPTPGDREGSRIRCCGVCGEESPLPREGEDARLPAGELFTALAAELGLEVDAEDVPWRAPGTLNMPRRPRLPEEPADWTWGRAAGGVVGEVAGLAGLLGLRPVSAFKTLCTKPGGSVCGLGAWNFGAGKGVCGSRTIECATRCKSSAWRVVTTVPRARAMAATSSG